ncbi:hypothetical protein [Streptomyces sp. NPDC006879]|uniref:hypothetical protein n=1 Tax=Streptomyces sp. NPDC006879 TaxID=3364767 RepID=UPI0036AD6084
MSNPIETLTQAIREQVSNEEQGLADQLQTLINEYQAREDERQAEIDAWFDESGDVKDGDYDGYDDTKWNVNEAGHEDLVGLLAELAGLLPDQV